MAQRHKVDMTDEDAPFGAIFLHAGWASLEEHRKIAKEAERCLRNYASLLLGFWAPRYLRCPLSLLRPKDTEEDMVAVEDTLGAVAVVEDTLGAVAVVEDTLGAMAVVEDTLGEVSADAKAVNFAPLQAANSARHLALSATPRHRGTGDGRNTVPSGTTIGPGAMEVIGTTGGASADGAAGVGGTRGWVAISGARAMDGMALGGHDSMATTATVIPTMAMVSPMTTASIRPAN